MKIGIDVRCLSEGKRTGVEEYTLALLQELFRTDRENEYILFFNAWKETALDFSWATQYPNVTLRVFRFPNKLLNFCLWYLQFPKLDRLLGGTEVFFLPNLNFAAVSQETKLVVTSHDVSFELFPETFSWKQRLWHFLVNFRRLAKRADRIIAVSQSTKDDLVSQYRLPADTITVIPSGIGAQFYLFNRNDSELMRVKEKYHLPYRFILYLGTFEPRKNIIAIIRAYEALMQLHHPALHKYELVLAGAAGWKSQDVYDAIAVSPYQEKIRLPGFIEDGDKAVLYNLASVFVYPSLYEGFGFPPLEAMACGVPVITAHSSSLPEVVGAAGIMVDPYQPDELFQALKNVLLDPTLCHALRQSGLKQKEHFTWKKSAALTRELFMSL